MAKAARAGTDSGTIRRQKIVKWSAPSILADSMIDDGSDPARVHFGLQVFDHDTAKELRIEVGGGWSSACAVDTPVLAETSQEVAVCADGPTVYGIDVSRFQGTIDWQKMRERSRELLDSLDSRDLDFLRRVVGKDFQIDAGLAFDSVVGGGTRDALNDAGGSAADPWATTLPGSRTSQRQPPMKALIQRGRKKMRRLSRIHSRRSSDGRSQGRLSEACAGSLKAPSDAVTHSSFSRGSSR